MRRGRGEGWPERSGLAGGALAGELLRRELAEAELRVHREEEERLLRRPVGAHADVAGGARIALHGGEAVAQLLARLDAPRELRLDHARRVVGARLEDGRHLAGVPRLERLDERA